MGAPDDGPPREGRGPYADIFCEILLRPIFLFCDRAWAYEFSGVAVNLLVCSHTTKNSHALNDFEGNFVTVISRRMNSEH